MSATAQRRVPWQRCPACGRRKAAARELCRPCWRAAPPEARRNHFRTLGRFNAGYVFADRVVASKQNLARATREARFGLELAL